MPLRVLILTYIYTDGDPRYGGEGRVVWETTQALARAGVKVFVATSMLRLKGTPHPNIRVYRIPFAKKEFLNFNAGELLKMFFFCIPLIFLKKIDVIHHLPTNGPDPFARFKFGRVFAESADPPWDYDNPVFGKELKSDQTNKMKEAGYTAHKTYDLSTRIAWHFFRFFGVNESYPQETDIFFPRTRTLQKTLEELHPRSKVVFVPNGVDPITFNPTVPPLLQRPTQGIRFLHVGAISRRKGTYYLVQSFIKTLEKYPGNELLLIGNGESGFMEELKNLAVNQPQVRFYGRIADENLPAAYTSADVFCLVPLSGSTPTVLSEAFASGLPVIATRGSGSGEAVEEHRAGFLVDPGNIESLTEAMLSAIEDRSGLKEKAGHALAASRRYTWDFIAREIIGGYRSVLKKNGRSS